MKKVLVVPDSFKGSMSSREAGEIIRAEILQWRPGCEIVNIPMADGGEGSVDCFLAAGGRRETAVVSGPFGERITCSYGILNDGTTAVIETASCAGLSLAAGRENPEATTTYGIGELISAAVAKGCVRVILCLGGSCTNDGGTGAAAALGVRFLDRECRAFIPVGGSLNHITEIDLSARLPKLENLQITAMCDVNNLLCGEEGAAAFAPQKGASPPAVRRLQANLEHLSGLFQKKLGFDVSRLKGGGAAGGLGAGAAVLLGAELKPGIETILDAVHFDRLLEGADFVITGEGRLDSQSLRGKAVIGIAERAKAKGIPVIALVGDISDPIDEVYAHGVSAVFSINRVARPFSEVKQHSRIDLCLTMRELLRFQGVLDKQRI